MTNNNHSPRIIVAGSYHTKNFGDQLIADMLGRHFYKSAGVLPICPWLHPEAEQHVSLKRGQGLLDCHGDLAIFGGGGYLRDKGYRTDTHRLIKHAITSSAFRLSRTPYAMIGAGAGPDLTNSGALAVRSILRSAKRIALRDQETINLITTRCGIKTSKIEETADIVLGLTREEIPKSFLNKTREYLISKRSKSRRLCLHLQSGQEHSDTIVEIIKQIGTAIKDKDISVVYLFDHGNSGMSYIREAGNEWTPGAIFLNNLSPWEVVSFIGECDAVLTTKLHVGICSWALGVPTFGVSVHGKTKRFYRQIGRSDFQCDLSKDAPSHASNWIDSFSMRQDRYREECGTARKLLPYLARRNFEIIDELFELYVKK